MSSGVHSKEVMVRRRLDELFDGLTPDLLRESVLEGAEYIFACTDNDAKQAPGYIGWDKITRAVRERLIPLGWCRSDEHNQARTTSPDGSVTIVIAAGNDLTGIEGDSQPTTRSPKGPVTASAVEVNQRSFAEVMDDPAFIKPPTPETWILLYYVDEDAEEIRVELSFPEQIASNGFVAIWNERIILPAISLGGPGTSADADEEDEAVESEIRIIRRSAS